MPRRSPNDPLVIRARLPIGFAGLWEVVKRLNEDGLWSSAMLDAETNLPRATSTTFVRRLAAAGIAKLMKVERGKYGRPIHLYRLARIPREVPRLRDDGKPADPPAYVAMWRAIRATRTFRQRDIAFAATVGKPLPISTVRWYCAKLLEAGYLIELPRAHRNQPPTYRLKPAMNTGPKAPLVLQVQTVWDPNLSKLMVEDCIAKEVA